MNMFHHPGRTHRMAYGIAIGLLAVAGIAHAAPAADIAADIAADRKAILAMQGEYTVDFAFDETVLLQPATSAHRRSAPAATRR